MLLVQPHAAAGRREVRAPVRFQDEFKNLYRNEAPSTSKAIEEKANERKAAGRRDDQEAKKDQKLAHVMGLRKRLPINYADKGRKPAAEKEKEKEKDKKDKKGKGKANAKAAPKPVKGKAPLKAKPKPNPKRKIVPNRKPFRRGRVPAPRAHFRFNPAPAILPFPPGFPAAPPVVRPLEEFLLKKDSPAAKRLAEAQTLSWDPQTFKPELFDLKLAHLKEAVPSLYEELPLADVTANELMKILKETEITPKELDHWKAYAGHNLFISKEDMARNLETVVTYCENDAHAGKGIKNKLRLVTQILKDDNDARAGILIMLAQHGGVCNIMKELAVNLAYSMLSNNLKEFIDKQSLKTMILRHLQTFRSLISEELYHEGGAYMNSHAIIAFQNGLAEHIGLDEIPDVHQAKNPANEERVKKFFEKYTPERIVQSLSSAMNDKERKIPYNTVLEWLQQNSPKEDAYEFLSECFDEKGHFTSSSILYILYKLEILV